MHSPSKTDKLIVQEDNLEASGCERNDMPQEIWDDIVKRENSLYYALAFLNGSVMWAYYSCLSAQSFYQAVFPRSGLDFSFLTTLATSWLIFVGQSIQMALGLDKKVSQ